MKVDVFACLLLSALSSSQLENLEAFQPHGSASGSDCHSLVVSSNKQRIGKRNYLGPGAWEAAGASTRGRKVRVSFGLDHSDRG